jgi:hypothetical protein
MPIQYTEKGYGLHLAIAAAGHRLEQRDGAWISSDDDAVQAIVDSYTLDQAKAYKRSLVSVHGTALRNQVIGSYSPGEMASWPIKLAEARALAAGASAEHCPMLAAEATARGITVADLAAKVGGNATTFAGLEATIAGIEGKHRDAIAACATFDAVEGYDYTVGWPEV